jgi:2-C-methyl-D-erythritol 2,4-cyclodiphosphate synthase
VVDAGFAVANVDATVVLERPKLEHHRVPMEANLAGAMGIAIERVSVKATSGEGMGFVGRGEGAAALAVATIES